MEHYHYFEREERKVYDFGSKKTTIRVLIDEDKAPNFIMRRFEIKPGGNIGIHSHPWEHEIYILSGTVHLIDDKGNETEVTEDEFVYIPPDEPHGYINKSDENVVFLCVIPKTKK